MTFAFTSALTAGPVEIVGRLTDASNVALFGYVGDIPVIYKPVRGERPLWDFPTGNLAQRERASGLVDAAGGWGIVPPTELIDGPLGIGSVQAWVTTDPVGHHETDSGVTPIAEEETDGEVVDELFVLAPPGQVEVGWLPVLTGELADGTVVTLAHADTAELRSVAVLDAVLNNSDRKGSHLLRAPDGHLWGIDHGVTMHEDPKLRTVLWGWAGEELPDEDLDRLRRLDAALRGEELPEALSALLTAVEIDALLHRVEALLRTGRHPSPQPGWPSVPWPAL